MELELLLESREGTQKKKKSLSYKYLEEYRTSIIVENDINRYFNIPGV